MASGLTKHAARAASPVLPAPTPADELRATGTGETAVTAQPEVETFVLYCPFCRDFVELVACTGTPRCPTCFYTPGTY